MRTVLVHRSDIWVPPPSPRAVRRCAAVLVVAMAATVLTHVASPVLRLGTRPAAPGACYAAGPAIPALLQGP